MSGDYELNEEDVIQILAGLRETMREETEKRHAKFWADIKVPFTLGDILERYTKEELNTIRRTLDIPNASTLRKAELTRLLQEKIPDYLDKVIGRFDVERFQLLRKIAKNDGQIIAPDLEDEQIMYFRSNGLVYTGTSQGKKY